MRQNVYSPHPPPGVGNAAESIIPCSSPHDTDCNYEQQCPRGVGSKLPQTHGNNGIRHLTLLVAFELPHAMPKRTLCSPPARAASCAVVDDSCEYPKARVPGESYTNLSLHANPGSHNKSPPFQPHSGPCLLNSTAQQGSALPSLIGLLRAMPTRVRCSTQGTFPAVAANSNTLNTGIKTPGPAA